MLLSSGVIQLREVHFSIYDSRVQEWLSLQAVVLTWHMPPRVPDTNLIENIWNEMKKVMQEIWLALSPTTGNDLRTLVWDAWVEDTLSQFYVQY